MPVKLTRIDAVTQMAAAVEVFRGEAVAALEELDMEVRRSLEWIHHDRHDHWNHEVRLVAGNASPRPALNFSRP